MNGPSPNPAYISIPSSRAVHIGSAEPELLHPGARDDEHDPRHRAEQEATGEQQRHVVGAGHHDQRRNAREHHARHHHPLAPEGVRHRPGVRQRRRQADRIDREQRRQRPPRQVEPGLVDEEQRGRHIGAEGHGEQRQRQRRATRSLTHRTVPADPSDLSAPDAADGAFRSRQFGWCVRFARSRKSASGWVKVGGCGADDTHWQRYVQQRICLSIPS